MDYKVAVGHNQTGSLQDWNVPKPPRCPGVGIGRRLTAGNGLVYQDGARNTVLEFSYHTPEEKEDIETQLALDSDTGTISGEYTVTLPKNKETSNGKRAFGNFNCTLTLPPELESTSLDRGKWLPYAIQVTNLVEIS